MWLANANLRIFNLTSKSNLVKDGLLPPFAVSLDFFSILNVIAGHSSSYEGMSLRNDKDCPSCSTLQQ